ncbi:C40 family peptidase [Streptomyces qinglanensis]|uniref:Cell wall-associated hydrolase, NlpC family n=1 Tax=Streptomyces qinglanensis TaxID=943816 RepID=A0A1H9WT38_9ACTN|nr:C40 family peptidase [Streptomyces qinglanensis]SES36939.1 Cell wall-associated hydrolase, NlpC family [Streptomyces qinglanensis]
MSPKAQIPSHRKPRSSKMNTALRAGMTGGVMGTIALTAAAAPALAADKNAPADTVEMPTLSTADSNTLAAESLHHSAQQYSLQQAQQDAAAEAKQEAKETKKKAEAEAKRKAEAKKKAEAARKAAAEAKERASRSTERSSLTTTNAAAPQGGNVATLLSFLRAQVGKSYVMGATGPSAYDCSGLTQAAYKQVGVNLPRTSQPQSTAGTPVSLDNLQPGDLLYWGGAGSAYHVAVYVGGGKFIGAQNSSTGIVERPLSYDQPTGAVRVL